MNWLAQLGHWVTVRYAESVEPILFGLRESRRLSDFGILDSHTVPQAAIDLSEHTDCCVPRCSRWIERNRRYYGRFLHVRHADLTRMMGSGHMAMLDFAVFDGHEKYVIRQRKLSGNFFRDAIKATKRGYVSHDFQPQDHIADMLDIRRSMRVRSFGIVLDAFTLKREDLLAELEQWRDWRKTPCLQHWEAWRGLFLQDPDHIQDQTSGKGRLVAYAAIHRIGNVARYAEFMGHGEHLRQGVMMALHNDVIAWLLDESNDQTRGVRYLSYGAIEQGGEGLAFWKRKALFHPHTLMISTAS